MDISGLSPGTAYSAAVSDLPQDRPAVVADPSREKSAAAPAEKAGIASSTVKLSAEALDQIRKLQARDSQVRQHELAHLAAASGLAVSGPTYTYQKGPDGVSYAIGGEVNIDVSAGSTPQETIARAQTIQAAALAPADPSGPDRAIAAQARQMEAQARVELLQQKAEGSTAPTQGKQPANVAEAYGATEKANNVGSGQVDIYA